MSTRVSNWVWHHAPVKSGELVVLLALADNAHDDGGGAYPTVPTIASKARLSERQVQRCLRSLVAGGLISDDGVGPNGATSWRLLMSDNLSPRGDVDVGGDDMSGVTLVSPFRDVGVTHNHQEPSGSLSGVAVEEQQHDKPPLLGESATQRPAHASVPAREGRKPVTYRGRTVPRPTVQAAEHLLDVFADATGSRLAPRTGDGRPSQALKQIVGALLERPDEPSDVWERGVRAMVADPPGWIDGRLMVGHLFGPRAAEHTITRGRSDHATVPRRGGRVDWAAIAAELEAEEAAA